jgi:hypothetical protein
VPKGGVVADTVGMGKTAQLIALLLAQPPPASEAAHTLSALVLTPEHLCHQWRAELARFAGDALRVAILTNEAELGSLPFRWMRGGSNAPRVLVASLEFLCGQFDACLSALSLAHAARFDRLILDECHDAVLLNGGHSMSALLQLRDCSRKVWCVTGTPFPQGDQSVFGLHQLLGVDIKFVIVNSPFMRTDRPLPRDHPFEQLKRLVYLRNTPESVGGEVSGSRLVEEAPHTIEVTRLRLDPIERAFYEEAARRVAAGQPGDSFTRRFDGLRRLCCHPATSEVWSRRLAQERSGGGSGSASGGGGGGGGGVAVFSGADGVCCFTVAALHPDGALGLRRQ